jgi:predicted nucleic acid-binding protein
VDHDLLAVDWLGRLARDEVHGTCPDLLYAEVMNTVLKYQRAGRLAAQDAKAVLDATAAIPFATHTAKSLAVPAWIIASERGLSAYDACYVVLAETMGATLITADRRLAASTNDAVLITG